MPADTQSFDATVAQVTKLPRVPAPEGARKRGQRLHTYHQTDIRDKIQTSQIVKRLQDHIDGRVELLPTQVACAKILLDRTVATLTAVEVTKVDTLPPESDLLAAIQRIIANNPQLLSTLVATMPQLVGAGSTADTVTPE